MALATARFPATRLIRWFDGSARDLPWRRPGTSPWAVLVSEIMLQQTPVHRVRPVFEAWLDRWPTPAALAAAPSGEAVRAWGRLGYPRRALRLHACAVTITTHHDGTVPRTVTELLTLPGVGEYTARAVAAFAYGARVPVVDTNVRRVVARAVHGRADGGPATSAADLIAVAALLPRPAPSAVRFSAALMELGALVCTARRPTCELCPVRRTCAWHHAGQPASDGPGRRGQSYEGTDRQARGRLLALVRDSAGPVSGATLLRACADADQARRALRGLLEDGLVVFRGSGHYGLPEVE